MDLLYNGVFKLKFQLKIEDYLLDLHFDNKKLRVSDEKAAEFATDVYYNISQGIIKEGAIDVRYE